MEPVRFNELEFSRHFSRRLVRSRARGISTLLEGQGQATAGQRPALGKGIISKGKDMPKSWY